MILAEITVTGLIAYRIWRLIAVDSITKPLRERIEQRGFWWDWLSCPWCSGTWLALGVALGLSLIDLLSSPWWLVGAAAAVVVGWLGDRL
jgi:hypothetical protein